MKTTRLLLCATAGTAFALATAGALFAEDEPADPLVDLVVGLLHDSDKDIRALAFEQVRSQAKGAAATRVFATQLAKLSPVAQVGLLGALADRGDGAARPAVLELLAGSKDATVRVAAVAAIGAVGQPADAQMLVLRLAGDSKDEQASARASLIRLRGEDVPARIATEIKSAAPAVQVALIEILAVRRALVTVPDLLSAAVSSEPAVRGAAMKALGGLAGPEHIPGMVQGVLGAEPGREREAAEKCVMFVCKRSAAPDTRAVPLLAAIEKLENPDRLARLSTLGRVGGSSALKIIEGAIAEADSRTHDLGIRAVCNWPDASIAPRLIELAGEDEHESHRIRALRALIRVAPLPDQRSDDERLVLLGEAMKMATRDEERILVLDRARAVRTLASLQSIVPYMDQPPYAERACLSIVELAHHRELREAHKAEFHRALDKVMQTSKDPVVVDRAKRYKNNQTWVRPARPK